VLEGVLGVRRRAAPKDQFGVDELRQGVIQLRLRHRCDRTDQLVRERTSQRRADLRHFARRRPAIEPRQE
jgi:hypothetical protein